MRVYRRTEHVRMPWRNGDGVTFEAVREPPDNPLFDLRLSFATIERSGPFSSFDGYERVIVLVEGGPATLVRSDDPATRSAHELMLYEEFRFPGEWAIAVKTLGPCTAFNLIVRKDHVHADVCIEQYGESLESVVVPAQPGIQVFLVVLSGVLDVADSQSAVNLSALDVIDVTHGCVVRTADSVVIARISLSGAPPSVPG